MEGEGRQDETSAANGNGRQSLSDYVSEKRLETGIFVLRLSTVIHGILAAVPILLRPDDAYQRCLVSFIAVSAFRLSQRVTGLSFNTECMQRILSEDSGHYLLYCFLFAMQRPAGVAFLMPVVLFSLLHSATFLRKLNEATGAVPAVVMQGVNALISRQQQLLMSVANTEMILMVLTIVAVFGGSFGIFVPFMYYRFLSMRYVSSRNPYSRHAFTQLRMIVDFACTHPKCPDFARRALQVCVRTVQRIAPPAPAAP